MVPLQASVLGVSVFVVMPLMRDNCCPTGARDKKANCHGQSHSLDD